MKYPESQYNKLIEKMPVLLKHSGLFDCLQPEDFSPALLNNLHFRLFSQLNYSEDNANVIKVNGRRLFDIDVDFKLYPTGCDDSNIETAMKKAIKAIYNKG